MNPNATAAAAAAATTTTTTTTTKCLLNWLFFHIHYRLGNVSQNVKFNK